MSEHADGQTNVDPTSREASPTNRGEGHTNAASTGRPDDWMRQHNATMRRAMDAGAREIEARREALREELALGVRDGVVHLWLRDPEKLAALRRALDPAVAANDDAFLDAHLDLARLLGISTKGALDFVASIRAARGVRARLSEMRPKPRPWIIPPWLIKGFISVLAAPGGRGKTSLLYLIVLAVLTGEDLLGLEVRRPSSVMLLVQEDDKDEFQRRFLATARHHRMGDGSTISDAAFCGRELLVRTSPFLLADHDEGDGDARRQRAHRVRIDWRALNAIIAACKLHGVGVVAIDPFSNIFGVDENTRNEMAPVMDALTYLAAEAGVAVLLVHHTRKGGAGETGNKADAVRGSSVVTTKARAVLSVETMTADAAQKKGVPSEERRSYFRVDLEGKSNMAPVGEARWFRMIGHILDNATDEDPADVVGVAERWIPPPTEALTGRQNFEALRIIDAGTPSGERWSRHRQSPSRFVASAVAERLGVTERVVLAALQEWERTGVVREVEYPRPNGNRARGLVVDPAALSAAEHAAEGNDAADELPF